MSQGSGKEGVSHIGERGFETGKAITGPRMTEAEPLKPIYYEKALKFFLERRTYYPEYGLSLPLRYDMSPEGWLPDSYTTIRRIYGMGDPLIKC